ncbi:MAG: S8 family serine peptidase [Candidatus Heimdallarchaeum endolithica]|uniref:S8 family serine peptidase n=1 Tax=Candidatus Heimdallarchaeum endolithica TaxID=2876572 RepID=A0A9Y1BTE0_9ARCH|nr:MAG: S8 family serine peptidase [Candidatus Heimdallarchaeum endolithica]
MSAIKKISCSIILVLLLSSESYGIVYDKHSNQENKEAIEKTSFKDVFKEKQLLEEFNKASADQNFRFFLKPRNYDSRVVLLNEGRRVKAISIIDGLFGTYTKTELIDLINRGLILSIWNNSQITIADSGVNISSSLVQNTSNFTEMINATTLWKNNIKGDNVTVAILDTGILKNHPALNATQDGKARIIATKNFFDENSYPTDNNGHGSALAGIIGSNGLFGYPIGVSPNCNFIIGKILTNEGQGTLETLLSGIDWAISQGADIINLSIGKRVESLQAPEIEAVNNAVKKGIIIISAVGNSRGKLEFGYNSKFTVLSPGIASDGITVGAIDNNEVLYEFSSGGPVTINYNETEGKNLYDFQDIDYWIKPDVVSPGVRINTTTNVLDSTKIVTGTSYSTAVVSGLCALILSVNKEYKPSIIKSAFLESAKKLENNLLFPSNKTTKISPDIFYQGAGLVDAVQILEKLENVQDFTVWPSDLTFIERRLFINEKKQFYISLFINKPIEHFKVDISSKINEGLKINNLDSLNSSSIGQYNLVFSIDGEKLSLGTHKGEITFLSSSLNISLFLQINIISAKGKVLVDFYEEDPTDYYSLKGSLTSLAKTLRKLQLVTFFLRRDIEQETLSSLNLLDYDIIVLINPNGTSKLKEYYSSNDLEALKDYVLPKGKYKGGSLLIFPSQLSDFNFIANLTNLFKISLNKTEIENEFFKYSFTNSQLFSFPNEVSEFYIPNPFIIKGENSSVRNYENRFAYVDYRHGGGSLVFVANNINMFLSSPYLYSTSSGKYDTTRSSSKFEDNTKLLENIIYTCAPTYMITTVETEKNEFVKNEKITLEITLENFHKYVSGWTFAVTLENEKTCIVPSFQYIDLENGSYSIIIDLEKNNIKPGHYSLVVRSFAGNEKIEVDVITNFSLTPRLVEIPLIICIITIVFSKSKKKRVKTKQ